MGKIQALLFTGILGMLFFCASCDVFTGPPEEQVNQIVQILHDLSEETNKSEYFYIDKITQNSLDGSFSTENQTLVHTLNITKVDHVYSTSGECVIDNFTHKASNAVVDGNISYDLILFDNVEYPNGYGEFTMLMTFTGLEMDTVRLEVKINENYAYERAMLVIDGKSYDYLEWQPRYDVLRFFLGNRAVKSL